MTIANYSDFKFQNHPSITRASRIIISEGSKPYRTVLRKLNEVEYTTHQENVILDGETWKHGDFYWGHYFNASSDSEEDKHQVLTEVHADYIERCDKM